MDPDTAGDHGGFALGTAAAEWAGTRRVRLGDRNIRYREAGRGTPLVLVHGLGMSADYWFRIAPRLAAAGYRVLAPDLPGFGRTAGPPGGLTVVEQTTALLDWARALGLGPAVFLGHSLSCQVVLELAATAPHSVHALLLMEPTGTPAEARQRLLRQALGLLLDAGRESIKVAVTVAAAYLQAGIPRVWRTWVKGARHDPTLLLSRIGAPVLVIEGDRDPVVVPSYAARLAEQLPSGSLAHVEGATHAAHFSRPDALCGTILEFLGEIGLDAGAACRQPTHDRPGDQRHQ